MKYCFGVVLAIAFSVNCQADVWSESGDAGSFPIGGFQATIGLSTDPLLTSISGTTSIAIDDIHDAFGITIVDPSWSITASGFDSRLWLFDTFGTLLMSNDDDPAGGTDALLGPTTSWGGLLHNAPTNPTIGSQYILVVAGFDESLHDSSDVTISQTGDFTDLNGIDPASGAIDHWAYDVEGGTPETGAYTITLTGIEFFSVVPEPGAGLIIGSLGVGIMALRRKKRSS